MASVRLRILAIEDDVADGRLLRYAMQGEVDFHARVTIVRDLATAISTLERVSFDLVLVDLNLPDSSGLATLHRVRAVAPDQPIVIVTGTDDLEIATAGLEAGALDFIVKGQMSGHFLVRSFQYALERHRLEREVQSTRHRIGEASEAIVSTVAGRLGTPVAALSQWVELLREERAGGLSAEQREIVEALGRNVHRVERAMADMLDPRWVPSRSPRLRLQRADISDLVESVVGEWIPTAERRHVDVELRGARSRRTGGDLVDTSRLRGALGDLLRSAILGAPLDSTLGIDVEVANDPPCTAIALHGTRPFDGAIFDDLVAEAAVGEGAATALGLRHAESVVKAHGGSIELEDGEPGTRIRIVLPSRRLRDLVQPMARRMDRERAAYTIVRLDLTMPEAQVWTERRLDAVHAVITQSLVPGYDVELPFDGNAGDRRIRLPLLVHVRESAALALAERIRMDLDLEFRDEDVDVAITLEALRWNASPTVSFDATLDALLGDLAAVCPWSVDSRA